MKNIVRALGLCLGVASLALGQTTNAPIYQMSILAGIPTPNSLGDNGPSTFGIVSSPQGIALDKSGNIFIADNNNNRIRRIDATTQMITTYTTSNISSPIGLAFDSKGNLLVLNNGNDGQIIRVTPPTTPTGSPTSTILVDPQAAAGTYGGDGDYAYSAWLDSPSFMALDANDDIFLTDSSNGRIREIPNVNNCLYTPITTGNNQPTHSCKIITIAGLASASTAGTPAFGTTGVANVGTNTVGDGGLALLARLSGPSGIAVTPDGSKIYVADTGDDRIRVINMLNGTISTLIGNCAAATTKNNGAVNAGAPAVIPCAAGSFGSATATGVNASVSNLGDGKPSTQGTTNGPRGLFLDNAHSILYFCDTSNNRIRAVNLTTGIVDTVVGSGSGTASGDQGIGLNSGLLTSIGIPSPYAVWVQNGLIYWVENGTNKVRVADPVADICKTLVNQPRSSGSGGLATGAYLGFATNFASSGSPRVGVDNAGNVYIVEATTNRVRVVNSAGMISDWAGTGVSGSIGDGGPATVARLNDPQSVAFDSNGNGYIADVGNNKIRMVSPTGIITTVVGRAQITTCSAADEKAGTCAVDKSDYVGDGGPPANAVLSAPQGIAVDSLNNLIIADTGHHCIRYADMTNNVIRTIAGGQPAGIPGGPNDGRSGLGTAGYQDSTNALYGTLDTPRGVAVDSKGNIYIASYTTPAGRWLVPVNPAAGSYSLNTFYGSNSSSNGGQSAPTATTAGAATVPARIRMSSGNLTSVAVDPGGNIYYSLPADNKVVVIAADHSRMYEVAGGGTNDTGLNYTSSNGLNLQVPNVTGVAVDSNGVVYTADRTGLVRKLVCTKNCLYTPPPK